MTASLSTRAILLVDDDREVLDVVATLLSLETHVPVRSFTSPQAALQAFAAQPEGFQLVVTDFDMPGMNGADLLRQIRALRPELPAFVFSGSARQDIVASGLPADCPFLEKPAGLPALVEAIQIAEAA